MTQHATGTHVFTPDSRNDNVLIDVNGELFPRPEAKVSVFDSGFMLGDGAVSYTHLTLPTIYSV